MLDTDVQTMTVEEFDAWRDSEVRAELVDGRVLTLSPESTRADELRNFLGSLLAVVVRREGLGRVFGPNVAVHLPGGLRRVPDLLFVPAARLHTVQETAVVAPPDLAVEVVSPDSVRRDWRDKFFEYQQAGVQEYWIVDPQNERAEVYFLEAGAYVLQEPLEGFLRSAVVPGFRVRAEWLWLVPPPDLLEVLAELGVIRP